MFSCMTIDLMLQGISLESPKAALLTFEAPSSALHYQFGDIKPPGPLACRKPKYDLLTLYNICILQSVADQKMYYMTLYVVDDIFLGLSCSAVRILRFPFRHWLM